MPLCITVTGGRGVIEGLGKQLALSDKLLEPSYASLYWYGNTSSASVWYALGFIESARSLAAGDTVWQVGIIYLAACTFGHDHMGGHGCGQASLGVSVRRAWQCGLGLTCAIWPIAGLDLCLQSVYRERPCKALHSGAFWL